MANTMGSFEENRAKLRAVEVVFIFNTVEETLFNFIQHATN